MSIMSGRQKLISVVILLGVVGCFVALYAYMFGDVTISEARVRADMITIRSEFDERLVSLNVGASDEVKKGEVIATLDHQQADASVASATARIDQYQREIIRLKRQLEIVRAQRGMNVSIADQGVDSARSVLGATRNALEEAARKYQRGEELGQKSLLSVEQMESLRFQYEAKSSNVRVAGVDLATAILKSDQAREDYKATELIREDIKVVEANLREAEAGLKLVKIQREKHQIRSPGSLIINRTFVAGGDFVQKGQRLIMAHDPSTVRIEANARESQLRSVKLGARVRVVLDAFPGRSLEGEVTRVGSSAMSEFSVLPADTQATYVRVAQRIPIEIKVDWQGKPPPPGLLARIDVAR